MGKRKIVIRESAIESIAEAAWFIESKGMVATAEKFSDAVYDYIETFADKRVVHSFCRDPARVAMGLKCKNFGKKYTLVFIETTDEITICEFLPSKIIHW